jgi:hypothetical protein
MRWVKDRTGRFGQRPHYEPEELDQQCEEIISEFLKRRYGSVQYPVVTDDLTRLIEEVADDLDTYADLSTEGSDVEGVTDFVPGQRPRVRISWEIAGRPGLENRLRTTLTHEFGHVKFHDFMFQMYAGASLFTETSAAGSATCKRTSIIGAPARLDGVAGWIRLWRALDASKSSSGGGAQLPGDSRPAERRHRLRLTAWRGADP